MTHAVQMLHSLLITRYIVCVTCDVWKHEAYVGTDGGESCAEYTIGSLGSAESLLLTRGFDQTRNKTLEIKQVRDK